MTLLDAPTPFEPHVETIVRYAGPQTVHIEDHRRYGCSQMGCRSHIVSCCGMYFERKDVRFAIGSFSERYCKSCVKIRSDL